MARDYVLKALLGVLVALGVFGAMVLWNPMARYRAPTHKPTGADLEQEAMKDPDTARYIDAFKDTFPDEYGQLLQNAAAIVDRNGNVEAAKAALVSQGAQVFQRHKLDIARAPDDEMMAVLRTQDALLEKLDTRNCALVATGRTDPDYQPPAEVRPALVDTTVSMLRAARAGIDHPVVRPTTASRVDMMAFLNAVRTRGLTPGQLAEIGAGGFASAPPGDQCAIGRNIIGALMTMPAPQAARLWSGFQAH